MSTNVRHDVLTARIRKEAVKARVLITGMLMLLMLSGIGSLVALVSGADVLMTTVSGVLGMVGSVAGMLYAVKSGIFSRIA